LNRTLQIPRLPSLIKQRCPQAKHFRVLFSRCSVSSDAPSTVSESSTLASGSELVEMGIADKRQALVLGFWPLVFRIVALSNGGCLGGLRSAVLVWFVETAKSKDQRPKTKDQGHDHKTDHRHRFSTAHPYRWM